MKNCNEIIQGLPDVINGTPAVNGINHLPQGLGGFVLPPVERYLREGCYLLQYNESPDGPGGIANLHYGTMRIDHQLFGTIASGDLYFHLGFGIPAIVPAPNPGAGIPVFPIRRYAYYLRVTNILHGTTTSDHFTLTFQRYQYNPNTGNWTNTGVYSAEMYWTSAPASYPSEDFYLRGTVVNAFGQFAGTLSMGWVDTNFRKATVEVDRVSSSEFPENNGNEVDWESIFEGIGWEIDVIESEINLDPVSGISWSNAELHATLLEQRDLSNLNTEWRYHLLCVPRLDVTDRGVMYDTIGSDSNNVPREGAAISSHWVIPNTPTWGSVGGLRFGQATGPYFRTAVHEIGHAMGLVHNPASNGFMHTTPDIAANGGGTFPENIVWNFHRDDARRLNHWPDICVRPGGMSFARCHNVAPISPFQYNFPSTIIFEVAPLQEVVPIGAPVRVNVTIKNISGNPIEVPWSLSLASSFIKGKVETPCGNKKGFQSIYQCHDGEETIQLAPGKKLSHDLTLLRGADGALFAGSGLHKITVEVEWESGEQKNMVSSSCHIMITPPVDEAHAKAATRLLGTPDVHLVLILGGDHLKAGIEAIQLALKNKVLRPHYAVVEAKRIGRRFLKRNPDITSACKLIDKAAILSASEARRMLEIIQTGSTENSAQLLPKEVIKLLKEKTEGEIFHPEFMEK